ncbi:MAG: glycine--tRNA ligase subunit beta [Brevundimonas sp.]|uniref:glycine--tRNA ligase subunit beta n=1 Tax=Brevundimonas sp. TaxID=1871086 RepID=UPI0025BD095F|nr:glycine--tRNA ligase subunit beta [Brevundimonas sp.]MBX3477617.1 glycine--tRNA ligase subunit beta [Brevundimonas sp.]
MPQLLLEILSEEIPARMQAGAARDLERMASDRLKAAGLSWEALTTFAGPRRLTLVVEGLPAATPDREEEIKGPKTSAPEQALDGFLRKTGLTRDQLVERDGVLFAVISQKGRDTAEMIPAMVEEIVRGFPWPKSMRWGSGTLRWVRPIKRILCLFDGAVVPFAIEGIDSGDVTEGHRFLGSGRPFAVKDFADYRKALEQHFVLLDPADRRLRILEAAQKVCSDKGLALVDDDGLLDEVSGLAEWPTPILGDMDPQFLDLPPEVVQLSMKTHQKYFAVRDPSQHDPNVSRKLAPHFVVVANVEATDGGAALAAGNSRVLSARLNDARFFWDEDRKVGFDAWLKKLEGVTYHAKLGTMAERVERIAALAREIAPLVGADPEEAALAARYAKADLASGMVGEFPELQGVMGGYYARALPSPLGGEGVSQRETDEGDVSSPSLPAAPTVSESPLIRTAPPPTFSPEGRRDRLADAVRDHYRPQGPTDTVPTAPLTVAVALADKLDALVGFFAIDEKPTGSKDPFALRRAALGVIRILLENDLKVELPVLIGLARRGFAKSALEAARLDSAYVDIAVFMQERTRVALRDRGMAAEVVEAAFAQEKSVLPLLVGRVEALNSFLATDDGAELLAGYKRASNILRAEQKKGELPTGMVQTGLPNQPAEETALAFAAAAAATAVDAALDAEDFAAAMTALARLRAPVDAFFTAVMVNSDVPAERDNRLKLLGQVRSVMGRVADFGMIGG